MTKGDSDQPPGGRRPLPTAARMAAALNASGPPVGQEREDKPRPFGAADSKIVMGPLLIHIAHRCADDFFRSGQSGHDLARAIFAQRSHAHLPGLGAEDR